MEAIKRIRFVEQDRERGFSIILHAGTIIYYGNYVYGVPESSIRKLEESNICFKVL